MAVWTVPGTIVRIVDADTAVVDLDLGWHIRYTAKIRVEGIDAPELVTDAGQAARDHAATLLPPGTAVVVTSRSLDRYGRILGAITLPDGTDYATTLTAAGHARPYPPG